MDIKLFYPIILKLQLFLTYWTYKNILVYISRQFVANSESKLYEIDNIGFICNHRSAYDMQHTLTYRIYGIICCISKCKMMGKNQVLFQM